MPYARRSSTTRASHLRGSTNRGRTIRRRTKPNFSKIRYQPATARNQKSQIMANARLLARHAKLIRRHKVYTDWQFTNTINVTNSLTWYGAKLTDFSSWNPVLRQDPLAGRSTRTFIDRMVINMRATLKDAINTGISIFIVTPRKDFASRDFSSIAPQLTTEYIYPNPGAAGFNVRLNSNVVKVHHAKYITLTANGLDDSGPPDNAGNPFTTYRKWQVKIPFKSSVQFPAQYTAGENWRNVTWEMLPYYQKYYLIVFTSTEFSVTPGADGPFVTFDQLATCINSD